MRRLARFIGLGLLVALGGGSLTASAVAQPPLHVHFKIDETFETTLCGISVSGHATGFVDVKEFSSPKGHGDLLDTSESVTTFTNPETGKSVSLTFPGLGSGTAVENPDGTVTFTFVRDGADVIFGARRGDVLVQDVGRFVLETVVDFNDPDDPDDDVVVSQSVLFEAGPHPLLDGDVEFCDVIVAALT
jgi:hypothetical protein